MGSPAVGARGGGGGVGARGCVDNPSGRPVEQVDRVTVSLPTGRVLRRATTGFRQAAREENHPSRTRR